MRIKDIMPHIYEPVVHNYQDRGASKKRNNIKMLNILTKNIYLTDVKKQNKKSYLYLMNYSSKNEQFNISSNYVTINNLKVENTANKLLERVQSDSSGKYLINLGSNFNHLPSYLTPPYPFNLISNITLDTNALSYISRAKVFLAFILSIGVALPPTFL